MRKKAVGVLKKVFVCLIAVALAVNAYFALFCVKNSKVKNAESLYGEAGEVAVLSLWQIDSFEGGFGSRRQYLLGVAYGFEKKRSQVLVMVESMTQEGAKENFEKGIYPDMLSFGTGITGFNPRRLQTKGNTFGGRVNGEDYAVCWCEGGYVLFENENASGDTLAVGTDKNDFPFVALKEEGLYFPHYEKYSKKDAFYAFYKGKCKYLLGTQRDVFRLDGLPVTYRATPLKNFSDLRQYICVTADNDDKSALAREFIEYLASEENGERLKKIGMFPPDGNVAYDNEILNSMQDKKPVTLSAFLGDEAFGTIKDEQENYYNGDENAVIKLKKILLDS